MTTKLATDSKVSFNLPLYKEDNDRLENYADWEITRLYDFIRQKMHEFILKVKDHDFSSSLILRKKQKGAVEIAKKARNVKIDRNLDNLIRLLGETGREELKEYLRLEVGLNVNEAPIFEQEQVGILEPTDSTPIGSSNRIEAESTKIVESLSEKIETSKEKVSNFGYTFTGVFHFNCLCQNYENRHEKFDVKKLFAFVGILIFFIVIMWAIQNAKKYL